MLTCRQPQSPHQLAVLGSLWLASAGQLRLWDTMAHLPALADGRAPVFMASTLVLLAALGTLGFSLLAWARTIRPALSATLLATAWTTLDTPTPLDMPPATLLVLQVGVPLIWLWSHPVQPAADTWAQLLHNLGTAAAAAGIAVAVLILSVADFSWMWLQHPELVELLSPVRLLRRFIDPPDPPDLPNLPNLLISLFLS